MGSFRRIEDAVTSKLDCLSSTTTSSSSSSSASAVRSSTHEGTVLASSSAGCSRLAMAAMAVTALIMSLTMLTGVVADDDPGVAYLPKGVQVSLRAKWSGTPLLLEAGEFIAATREDLFWAFVQEWAEGRTQYVVDAATNESSSSLDERCAGAMGDSVRRLLGPSFEPVFRLSLSFREYSPKLVVYRQLARHCLRRSGFISLPDAAAGDGGRSRRGQVGRHVAANSAAASDRQRLDDRDDPLQPPNGSCCWVDVGGKKPLLEIADVEAWIEQAKHGGGRVEMEDPSLVEVHSFDHVISEDKGVASVAILYGAMGTACFPGMHSALSAAAREGFLRYVYRPVLAHGCGAAADVGGGNCVLLGAGGEVTLGGYGVELALKNMEYSAIDDSSVKKDVVTESGKPTEDLDRAVKGFIFSKLVQRRPEKAAELLTFRDHLMSAADIDDKINVWDLKDIGLIASQRIARASDPLRLLQEINQNFPSVVSSLSRMKLNRTVSDEIVSNQRMVMPGKNLLAINHAVVDLENLDLFTLMEIARKEIALGCQLSKLRVPHDVIKQMLKLAEPSLDMVARLDVRSDEFVHFLNDLEQDAKYRRWGSNLFELLMPMFPGQMRYLRKNLYTAVYVVDPASATSLRVIGSVMHYYTSNVPARFGIAIAAGEVLSILQDYRDPAKVLRENATVSQSVSTMASRLFYYVVRNFGVQEGFAFLEKLDEVVRRRGGGEGGEEEEEEEKEEKEEGLVSEGQLEEALRVTLKSLLAKEKKEPPLAAAELMAGLRGNLDYVEDVIRSTRFVHQKGLDLEPIPSLVMNGLVFPSTQLLIAMNEELGRIQEKVYYGFISQKTNVLDKLLQENAFSRYNPVVLSVDGTRPHCLELASAAAADKSILKKLVYLHHPETDDGVKPITHLVVVDVMSNEGRQLVLQALRHLVRDTEGRSRVAILHNIRIGRSSSAAVDDGEADRLADAAPPLLLPRLLLAATRLSSHSAKLLPFLQTLLESSVVQNLLLLSSSPTSEQPLPSSDALWKDAVKSIAAITKSAGLRSDKLLKSLTDVAAIREAIGVLREEQKFVKSLGIEAGANAVITNGRVLLLGEDSKRRRFIAEDFELLGKVEYSQRVAEVEALLEDLEWADEDPDDVTSEFLSTVIMAASSAVSSRTKNSETAKFEYLSDEHSAIVHQEAGSFLTVDAILDPISTTAQAITPLLILLRDWLQPSFRIILNPQTNLADLPLKNFYRFAQPLKKDLISGLQDGAAARFINMPSSRTLTMNLYVPEPWLVEPVVAPYDLDNLQLQKVDVGTMNVVFELEALMVTGHCFEQGARDPPRGLQLLLGTEENPHVVDTIVMANLGYFQLKAAPGVWALRLAPGRSVSLYTVAHADDDNTLIPEKREEGGEEEAVSVKVVVSDLRGKVVRMKVQKRPGKQNEKILWEDVDWNQDEEQAGNLAGQNAGSKKGGSWSDWFLGLGSGGGAKKKEDGANMSSHPSEEVSISRRNGETIHIFSVASGHLYERFLRIMILSVVKNTDRPVKFWFIKNYLSPSFKDLIPHMAREYDFEYELVTYKWPSWLHKQVEKQRIIWAYKILFLDVLFPLSLKKVIFVDADQIVRTDLGELYDMDLKGKPLAYTPFCDNNKEMDGYRFWKQGFWKDHLRGKPYHISALYVVHLTKFRLIAAGDHLRIVYESLSRDPNSLSNLDQDLPNYVQHKVPIFSLPNEWLWCESWCGNATKAKAKTIDLCNNPMTKEPKLEGAKRIVAEWPALDEEQRKFTEKIEGMYMEPLEPEVQNGSTEPAEKSASTESVSNPQQAEGGESSRPSDPIVGTGSKNRGSCTSGLLEEEGREYGSAAAGSFTGRDELR